MLLSIQSDCLQDLEFDCGRSFHGQGTKTGAPTTFVLCTLPAWPNLLMHPAGEYRFAVGTVRIASSRFGLCCATLIYSFIPRFAGIAGSRPFRQLRASTETG